LAKVTQSRNAAGLAILMGGLAAGTIDIGAACLINHVDPVVVLHAIASGVYGKAAFHGGTTTAVAGLLLQWAMSLIIAGVYVIASIRLPVLRARWVVGGLAYGAVVYTVMTFVVVPLSRASSKLPPTPTAVIENLLAMFVFGLIVAWFASRARAGKRV
jgi:hypothetical protein